MKQERKQLQAAKRIVIKIGSSSLLQENGRLHLRKLEQLVRQLTDFRNAGKEVILVSSGAIAVGRAASGIYTHSEKMEPLEIKQACAAIGQAKLMMIYEKLFAEYQQPSAQVLLTKYTVLHEKSKENARKTLEQLLKMGVIPIVNENDTVATEEIEFGDNDTLSAIVCALIKADLLILLSDMDGFYTNDPHKSKTAKWIPCVPKIEENMLSYAKGAGTFGTGGMLTKLYAAKIATDFGAHMVVANGAHVSIISDILEGKEVGTIFLAQEEVETSLVTYLKRN